jgi:hypothetical protein
MGPPAFLPIRKKGVLRIFIALKNPSPWPASNPQPLGPVASTLTTTPPRQPFDQVHNLAWWTTLYNECLFFWVETPCVLVGRYQRFRETYFIHLQISLYHGVVLRLLIKALCLDSNSRTLVTRAWRWPSFNQADSNKLHKSAWLCMRYPYHGPILLQTVCHLNSRQRGQLGQVNESPSEISYAR